jgi:hypothetical protein
MPVIFDDNHYCILAINVLEVAKEVLIDYNRKAELLTNDVSLYYKKFGRNHVRSIHR